jgi:hypothetical protein
MFLCDQETESECLSRMLLGSPQEAALWASGIQAGDDVYLFNFNTRIIRGPYKSASTADCYEPLAWRGRFPVQIKIAKTDLTKVADSLLPGSPVVLSRRRPAHNLGSAADQLLKWIQDHGKPDS